MGVLPPVWNSGKALLPFFFFRAGMRSDLKEIHAFSFSVVQEVYIPFVFLSFFFSHSLPAASDP